MTSVDKLSVSEDFEYLVSFLPEGWEQKAKELGALRRCRKIPNAGVLLRVLLIHLAEGCSLRETAVRASKGQLIELSDVAIMDRLRMAGEWFRWMNEGLMKNWVSRHPNSVFGDRWNVRIVDGTRIKEPGPTGSSWCVHYSVELPSLHCDELTVLDKHGNGESFKRYQINPGDLLIGDRGYSSAPGIAHVLSNGGEVLVRFGWNALTLYNNDEKPFNLFSHLRSLQGTQIGDWNIKIKHKRDMYSGRICALRKSRQASEKARKKARRKSQKTSYKMHTRTLEAADYIFVFTSVPRNMLSPSKVLEIYRGRWQIELVFKRFKSLMGLGHLRKRDQRSAKSWIHGKLLVSFLVEVLIRQGETLFPWGYPITK